MTESSTPIPEHELIVNSKLELTPELQMILEPEIAHIGNIHMFEIRDPNNPNNQTTVCVFNHNMPFPSDIPDGCGFKGGVARQAAWEMFGDKPISPRDIDLVSLTELPEHSNESTYDELSDKYMPFDSLHGYGIEKTGLFDFFNNRDFTINEIIALKNIIICTPSALSDLQDKIVRPTNYEKQRRSDGNLRHQIFIKAIRLMSEFTNNFGYGMLADIPPNQFNQPVPPFFITLQLDRALDRGPEAAQEFLNQLAELNISMSTPENSIVKVYLGEDVEHLINTLSEILQTTSLTLVNIDLPNFEANEELRNWQHFIDLALNYSSNSDLITDYVSGNHEPPPKKPKSPIKHYNSQDIAINSQPNLTAFQIALAKAQERKTKETKKKAAWDTSQAA